MLPRIPGHEIAGRIDAFGPEVMAWKVGDRIGVGWHGGHCFECDACRRGLFINCKKGKVTGITHDGGYAEYAVVPESVARIPEGLSAAGWPSGSAIDSEDTMAFSALTGLRPRVETFKLDQAEAAFAHMMENKVRLRAVLVM